MSPRVLFRRATSRQTLSSARRFGDAFSRTDRPVLHGRCDKKKERKKKKHTTSYPSSRRRFIGVGEGEDDVPDSTRREAGASSLSRHGRRNHFASARSSGARSRPLARANVAQSRGSATPAADPGFERPRGGMGKGACRGKGLQAAGGPLSSRALAPLGRCRRIATARALSLLLLAVDVV